MAQETRKITAVEFVWVALFGGALTYALTRLGYSFLFSLHNWSEGLMRTWKSFVWIFTTFPFFSFKEIVCFAAGAITTSIAYSVTQTTTKYKQFLFFWICIAALIYSLQQVVAISKIPSMYPKEPQSVVNELLWLNVYSLFCAVFSFVLSLVLVEYLFRKNAVRFHEIITRDWGGG